jgi:FAD/FMN-containing dehydrogenase
MRAKTVEGREIDLSQDIFNGWKARLRGPVLVQGDAGYEDSRTVWNSMIDRRPAMVVRCLGIADAIECVRFARDHNLLLCVKGGGHNIAGLAVADDALMLDMSLMRGVWVDPHDRVAHAQAGCVLGDVDRETQLHGLASVLGFVSLTGIAGLTLGGGIGYLTRRWGWTADNVVGMDVVTAEARHGTPIVAVLACHTGDPDEGEKAVAPLKSFGQPIGDVLMRRSYVQMQSLLDATQPKGRRYYWKSEYLAGVEQALLDKVIEHAARIPSPHSAVILFQIEGALNRLSQDHSPAGNRDARYLLNIASSWERPDDDEANIEWTRRTWSDLRRFSTGGTYINFLTEDEGTARTEAALGPALERLGHIKARWDPQNVFRTNRNIQPV